ncbi:hypothetical protein [Desulfitobacterium sp.]|uniref:hypothetical protein n=1 Tax=Desulfitobacterium sp. TaxID=49981 RepID=UPI002CC6FD29|nr:hypothetical protein [Desulfitobacterium sp.]HVJ47700.1 hypothetical protein [Desulfitobacterium sp.]
MKKINKKTGLVISGVVLALGILAVPVLAGTDSKTEIQVNVPPVTVTSQNIKTVADTPANPKLDQNTPNTQATPNDPNGSNSISAENMQSMHDSTAMQEAMNSGDTNKMKDAMNSPEIKAQLGEDTVNSMNEMMSNVNINAMHGSGAQGSSMMGSGARNTVNWQ